MKAAKDLDGDYQFYTLQPTSNRPYKARRGQCEGGYECTNPNCEDMTGDGTNNTTSFVCKTNPKVIICKICKESKYAKHHVCNVTRTVLLPEGTADAWIVDEGQHLSTCKSLKTRLSSAPAIARLHQQLHSGPKKVGHYGFSELFLTCSVHCAKAHVDMWFLANNTFISLDLFHCHSDNHMSTCDCSLHVHMSSPSCLASSSYIRSLC